MKSPATLEAIDILDRLFNEIKMDGMWDVAEAPDNHSFAWHGSNILRNAKCWLESGEIKPFDAYQPIYTR